MEVTALLLNWKRLSNLEQIIETLRRQSVPVEIFLWNNSQDKPKVSVDWMVDSSSNIMCGSRWWMALYAKSPYVFSLDDDLIPTDDKLMEDCVRACADVDMIGYQGVIFNREFSYMRSKHAVARDVDTEVDVVKGRFLFTRKNLVVNALSKLPNNLTVQTPSVEDDIILSSCASKKILPAKLRGRFKELPSPHALYRRPDHFKRRQETVERHFHA